MQVSSAWSTDWISEFSMPSKVDPKIMNIVPKVDSQMYEAPPQQQLTVTMIGLLCSGEIKNELY